MAETCKYDCQDGLYFEPVQRKMLSCPDCASDRAKQVRVGLGYSGNVSEDGIAEMVTVPEIVGFHVDDYERYDFNKVLPPEHVRSMVSGVRETADLMEEIINTSNLGVSLSDSYVIGLNSLCNLKHFVASVILNYYKSSGNYFQALSIKDYLEFVKTRVDYLNPREYEVHMERWRKIHSATCLVVLLTSGGNKEEIESAKGLMQARALKGEGTVFVTTMPYGSLYELTDGEEKQMSAVGSFILRREANNTRQRQDPHSRGVSAQSIDYDNLVSGASAGIGLK